MALSVLFESTARMIWEDNQTWLRVLNTRQCSGPHIYKADQRRGKKIRTMYNILDASMGKVIDGFELEIVPE